MNTEEIVEQIHQGEIGILPTDTLYGIVGSALIPETVEKIYAVKARDPQKPLIVLISSIDDLEQFGVVVSEALRGQLETYWPGPVSLVLPTIDETFEYLDRGTGKIAFRIPDEKELLTFLRETGPLVAPSANKGGEPPATTIEEAKKIFGSSVSFYIDGGEKKGKPSTLIEISEDGRNTTLRT